MPFLTLGFDDRTSWEVTDALYSALLQSQLLRYSRTLKTNVRVPCLAETKQQTCTAEALSGLGCGLKVHT